MMLIPLLPLKWARCGHWSWHQAHVCSCHRLTIAKSKLWRRSCSWGSWGPCSVPNFSMNLIMTMVRQVQWAETPTLNWKYCNVCGISDVQAIYVDLEEILKNVNVLQKHCNKYHYLFMCTITFAFFSSPHCLFLKAVDIEVKVAGLD